VADKFFQISAYLSYWLDAVDEHSLHSPFFFDFYTNIVKKQYDRDGVEAIERLRKKLLSDHRILNTSDPGSGRHSRSNTIASIARTSLSPLQFSDMYARMIRHFKAQTIIELGTSFGINTLYLAQKKDSAVATFEGSPGIADIAQTTFEFAGASNIQLIRGDIDVTLSSYLQSVRKVDFALIDANHRYKPTLHYFELLLTKIRETSVVVLDDIHYSKEMEKAWNEISKHKLVYGTADLYRCGILFFDPSLNKQHAILQV
jgi:predicted O-methyltransferase YrrM